MCRTRYLSLIIKITIYSPNSMSKNINRKMQIFIKNLKGRKGELHSEYIFLHFALIGLEWDSITLFTKRNVFSSKTHISKRFAQDIYGLLFTNVNIF